METIIQAGQKRMKIVSLPVTINAPTRKSRLFGSKPEYVTKSASAIIRAYIMYKPYVVFGLTGAVLFFLGLIPFGRFVYLTAINQDGHGHLQSLIVGSVLLTGAFICLALNIIADLIRINRVLIEHNLEHTKRMRFEHPRK
jgi:hypothetical protein